MDEPTEQDKGKSNKEYGGREGEVGLGVEIGGFGGWNLKYGVDLDDFKYKLA